MNKSRFIRTQGITLIEILVAIGVFGVIVFAVARVFVVAIDANKISANRVRANFLMEEYLEKVRSLRRAGWDNINLAGKYIVEKDLANNIVLTPTVGGEVIDGFTRYLEVFDIYRDSDGDIVEADGALDPSSKKATVYVSWTGVYPGDLETSTILTRYLDNLAWPQTTVADFNAGNNAGTNVVNNNGGEVEIAFNTKGKWCEPTLSSVTIDLPQEPNAVWAEPFNIYASSSSTSMSFVHVRVANTDPPSGTILGTFTGYNGRAVFGEPGYGYIATTNDSREIVIIDLNDYSLEGWFNSSGSTNGDTIFVLNNRGYMTAGNRLYVFNLSSKTGSRSQIGSSITFANSSDRAGGLYVRQIGSETFAWISIEGSTIQELKIANLTNHLQSSQWRIVGQINIEPNNCSTLESGKSVFVNPEGSRAYLSSTNDASFKEFFILDTTTKSNPTLIGGIATNPPCTNGGGYEAGGMDPEQSVVVSLDENRVVLVGQDDSSDGINSEEYQILNISDEGHPARCGGLHIDQGIFGVAAVKEPDGDAYAYLITGDSPRDLKIVQGGPDGVYLENGTFESQTKDTGMQTSFNRLLLNFNKPAQTDIRFQIAVVDPGGSGNCSDANFSDFNFFGPDGTAGTRFTESGPIPLDNDDSGYENPGQCVRVRAYLSTANYNATPSLWDLTINYSP